MQKLKAAIRSRKERKSTDLGHEYDDGESPRNSLQTDSPRGSHQIERNSHQINRSNQQINNADERTRRMSTNSRTEHGTDRSRPHSRHVSHPPAVAPVATPAPKAQTAGTGYGHSSTQESLQNAIANDYNAYTSGFPPETGVGKNSDRRPITRGSEGQYEGNVADQNTNRYRTSLDAGARKPLPPLPVPSTLVTHPTPIQEIAPNPSHGGGFFESSTSAAPSSTPTKPIVGRDIRTREGPVDSIKSHVNVPSHDKNVYRRSEELPRSPRGKAGVERSRRRSQVSDSDYDAPSLPAPLNIRSPKTSTSRNEPVKFRAAVPNGQQESEAHKQLRLEGVVDLRNTVDTDTDVQWAPAITHELLMPHQHEVVQHKVHREIHNYEVFQRLQPVIHTEVLPPRHWIPNPNGDGLIEIDAEELPSRTGENRWWSIVQQHPPPATYERPWRTQPQIVEGKTTISPEGFESKETIIFHPPTLADMSGYTGPVQPVHFDHKTGEQWLGEITTIDRLNVRGDHSHHPEPFATGGLAEALPNVPSGSRPQRNPVPANDLNEPQDADGHNSTSGVYSTNGHNGYNGVFIT